MVVASGGIRKQEVVSGQNEVLYLVECLAIARGDKVSFIFDGETFCAPNGPSTAVLFESSEPERSHYEMGLDKDTTIMSRTFQERTRGRRLFESGCKLTIHTVVWSIVFWCRVLFRINIVFFCVNIFFDNILKGAYVTILMLAFVLHSNTHRIIRFGFLHKRALLILSIVQCA